MNETESNRINRPVFSPGRSGLWINTTRPDYYMGEVSVDECQTDKNGDIVLVRGTDEDGNAFTRDLADKLELIDRDEDGRVMGIERECLEPGNKVDWSCSKHIREGDLSLFYRTAPAKDIRYLLRAVGDPRPEINWKFTCDFEVMCKFRVSLRLDEIWNDPFLRENWDGIRAFYRRTGVSVDKRVWRRLNQMLAERNPSYPEEVRKKFGVDAFAGIPPLAAGSSVVIPAGPPDPSLRERESGAGFGDAESNKETEEAAMKIAADWYEKRGWKVEDYSNRLGMGYDLHCTRGGREKHVEVKGISGDAEVFNMTAKEKQNAHEDDNFVVFVVTRARSGTPRASQYTRRQFARKFRLEADRFRATPSRTG